MGVVSWEGGLEGFVYARRCPLLCALEYVTKYMECFRVISRSLLRIRVLVDVVGGGGRVICDDGSVWLEF